MTFFENLIPPPTSQSFILFATKSLISIFKRAANYCKASQFKFLGLAAEAQRFLQLETLQSHSQSYLPQT
jgi:hypothetical protein